MLTTSRTLSILIALNTLALATGCRRQNDGAYKFEAAPRAVIAQVGLSPSRSASVAADFTSSPAVHILALVGESGKTRLAMLNSKDGGNTFGSPVWVSQEGHPVSSGGENSPALASTANGIYAAWGEGADIRFARSVSQGSNFEKPIKITDKKSESFSGYPSIGVAPNQDVYVVWIDTRDRVGTSVDNYAIYMARSTDHGVSFGKNIRVAVRVCQCCRPTLSFGPHGEVMVFWRHIYPGTIHDMTVAVTMDEGITFSPAKRVAADNWKIDGCPNSGPAVARSGNRVYVAWLTDASPEISGVRLTWSDDGGKTWAAAVKGSQAILNANHPAMSVAEDGRVTLVFEGCDPRVPESGEQTSVFAVEIGTSGKLSAPTEIRGIASPASIPTVASGTGGRVFVAWTGAREGTKSVFLSRATREAE